jgi:hypothetical protein
MVSRGTPEFGDVKIRAPQEKLIMIQKIKKNAETD